MELLAAAAFRSSDPCALPIALCSFARIFGALEGSIGVNVLMCVGESGGEKRNQCVSFFWGLCLCASPVHAGNLRMGT